MRECIWVLVSFYGIAQTYHCNFVPAFGVIRALCDESIALWGRQTHKAAITHVQMGFSTPLFVEHVRMNVSWQVSIRLAASVVCGCLYWQSKCSRSVLLLVACWLQAFPVKSALHRLSFSHLNIASAFTCVKSNLLAKQSPSSLKHG